MLFNSLEFLVFFPVVTAGYFLLPQRWRALWLIVASCVFYAAFIPAYLLIIFLVIGIDYVAGILMERFPLRRKTFLVASLVANIGLLCWFKYLNFVLSQLAVLCGLVSHTPPPWWHLDIVLPIGLSFHTFQSMSYTLEVYWGRQKAERNLVIYALYVLFYPQLVAGPIERPQNLLHQFRETHEFNYERVTDGLRLMLWGFFKKIVVADRLALVVNPVYDHPHDHYGAAFAVATALFAFQIFCDFSGYTDIARGAARVMGFTLMENFCRPYFSKTVAEFWKRWHISLSTWFRDYLYIPLGGNRVPRQRLYFNLFITFLISGLWHGANWTYLIWGGLNGCYLIWEIRYTEARERFWRRVPAPAGVKRALQVAATFCLICLAWVFFRANTVGDACFIAAHLTDGLQPCLSALLHGGAGLAQATGLQDLAPTPSFWATALLAILVLETVHLLERRAPVQAWLAARPPYVRWAAYYGAVFAILLSGHSNPQQFIYFQF